MYVVTWLLAFRLGVLSIRSQCSVKATGAFINLDNIEARDVINNVMDEIARTMDMMLH